MMAFKKHFFPNAYEKELADERSHDLKTFGTGLVKDLMEGVRRASQAKFRNLIEDGLPSITGSSDPA